MWCSPGGVLVWISFWAPWGVAPRHMIQKVSWLAECEGWCMMQVVPGARVPADGCVVEGRSHVDESMVTGESAPVRKRAGDSIISGTVNTSGPLIVQARRPYM